MTLLTKTDSSIICHIQLTGEGRWLSLALSLGDPPSFAPFLVRSDPLVYEIAGVDEMAREYGLSTWQGGIISGARYAFRALKTPIQQVCLHELRGQLGSGDVGAVSSAAALAVARLLARPAEFPLDLKGWTIEEEISRPPTVESVSASKKADSSPLEPLGERPENRSLASAHADTKESTSALPAKPNASTDLPGD